MDEQAKVGYGFLRNIPIPLCGVTLGVAAVGNLLGQYSIVLKWLYLAFAAVLWLALTAKLVLCWSQAKQEFNNPLVFSVFEAYFMTLLQFAAALAPYNTVAAQGLWWIAVVGGYVLIVLFSRKYLVRFQLANVHTSWNVLFGGNMLAAMSPVVYNEPLGVIIFWLHFILLLPWYPISMYRIKKLSLPEPVQPTVCILAAPFSLMLAGYLVTTSQPQLWIALLLAALAQVSYFAILLQLPKLLRLPYYPSYGAMTFPLVIPAMGLQILLTYLHGCGMILPAAVYGILIAEQLIAAAMVTYVLLRTCSALR